MKADALLLLGLVLCALIGYGGPAIRDDFDPSRERPPGTIRVVTWNVGSAQGRDGEPLRSEHLGSIVDALRQIDFDLAFVQELGSSGQARSIARELQVPFVTGLRGSRLGAFFAQRGRLRSQPVPRGSGRRPLPISFASRTLSETVRAVGLHCSPWSAASRNREIGEAFDLNDDGPRLLLGDLNLEVELEGRQDLYSDDAYLDLETYNYVAKEWADAGREAGPTAEPDRRIDYVFASPELEVVAAHVWRGRRSGAMDHEPLIVDLRLR